ncbi:hypothetical protein AB0283_30640 [Micromonospora vinacea]
MALTVKMMSSGDVDVAPADQATSWRRSHSWQHQLARCAAVINALV